MGKVSQNLPRDSSLDERGYPSLETVIRDEISGMEIIRYSNGTHSIRESAGGQTMHSRVGPETESKVVYADAARVSQRLSPDHPLILWDVGMGTASNVTATLDEIASQAKVSATLEVHSFESDPQGLDLMLRHSEFFPSLQRWTSSLGTLLSEKRVELPLQSKAGAEIHVIWHLHVGDFYSLFPKIPIPDLIYFDFYAPRAQPDLWRKERFRDLRHHLADHQTLLYTYSAATPVRLALLLGGFFVGYGPKTPMKAETTVAATRIGLLENPLRGPWRKKLEISSSVQDPEDRAAGSRHPQWKIIS